MNAKRFENLALVARRAANRRATLRALAAGALVAALARLGPRDAAAGCRKVGRPCERDRECCENSRCRRGKCMCEPGRDRCGKRCCDRGDICADGRCVTGQGTCPRGADTCAGDLFRCNGNDGCQCYRRLAGGTRCGGPFAGGCGDCARDTDCAALGPGAFCARSTEPECVACAPGGGRCVAPCPT